MKSVKTWVHLALILVLSAASQARGDLLFYNGDNDNRDSLLNAQKIAVNQSPFVVSSNVYDNFIVPAGQAWTLSGVYSNDQLAFGNNAVKTATWSIRTGLSEGNGGTVVAQGDTAATLTPIPPVPGNYYAGPEYKVDAAVTASVVLQAGTYWLSVSPDDPNAGSLNSVGDKAFIETTGGANAVGKPAGNDGNSFVTNTLPAGNPEAYIFTSAGAVLAADGLTGPVDFSLGVEGTVQTLSVPEPASVLLLLLGAAGAATLSRRRRRLAD